jgi:hypothetical protein
MKRRVFEPLLLSPVTDNFTIANKFADTSFEYTEFYHGAKEIVKPESKRCFVF